MEQVEGFLHYVNNFDGTRIPIMHDQPWQWVLPVVSCVLYVLFVFLVPPLIKKEASVKFLLAAWNLFLSVFSGLLFVFWGRPVWAQFAASGYSIYSLVCVPGPLLYGVNMFCAMLFAYSKYFELIDTVFLVIRKRPVNFLHWYHHTTVLLYTWFGVIIGLPAGMVFGIVNAFVHTIMYFYYFLAAIGQRPWWGQYVTILQLSQMVVGLFTSGAWAYFYLSGLPCPLQGGGPYVHQIVILSSVALYGSYFYLFLSFYLKRFGAAEKRPTTAAGKPGQASRTKKEE
ncbi:Elongation of very long chain fatty acids protein [Balamuthia mandrillaris]